MQRARGGGPFTQFRGDSMASVSWSSITNGQDITAVFGFDPLAGDVLTIDNNGISAGSPQFISWFGNVVTINAGGKTFTFTVTGGGEALSDANIVFSNGSNLFLGDNTNDVGDDTAGTFDDAAQNLVGTAGSDRFFGRGGDDTLSGGGGDDIFVLSNGGATPFGNDSVDGGDGFNDNIGVDALSSATDPVVVDFSDHTISNAQGSAVFTNIEAYDPASDSWQALPPMLLPRHGFGAAASEGAIYLPGGASAQGFGAVSDHTVVTFDAAAL